MDIRYDLRFSLEDTAAQIEHLEQYIGKSEVPLIEHETVSELHNAMQGRVAYAASEMMTGVRWQDERQQYLEAYPAYRKVLGAIATDTALRTYEESKDVDLTKKEVNTILRASKLGMVALDYGMRLQKSPLERAKQRAARSDRARHIVPFTFSSAVGAAGVISSAVILKSEEASKLEFTATEGGILSVAAVAITLALRSGVRKAGAILGNQANASILTYMLDKYEREGEGVSQALENLIGRYAMRHLESHSDKLGCTLLDFDMREEADIVPMIEKALDVSEAATHKSYGVDPNNEWPGPWYLKWPCRALNITMADQ